MGDRAAVESIEVVRHFRAALWKFAEAANSALADAEGEISRTLNWLEREQPSYWEGQIRKRHEIVERCKEAVRMKKLYKGPTGQPQSSVEEEKALRVAQRKLEVAHEKLAVTKSHARRLLKEVQIYKGSVQRFATSVNVDVPRAVAMLDGLVAKLEAYVGAAAPRMAGSSVAEIAGAGAGAGEQVSSMARAADQEPVSNNEEGKAGEVGDGAEPSPLPSPGVPGEEEEGEKSKAQE